MCGMTLKAICLVNVRSVFSSPTKMARVCSNSSSIPALPAPETGLIGRHHHPLDGRAVVKRLECDDSCAVEQSGWR